jgi:hypothetical protein
VGGAAKSPAVRRPPGASARVDLRAGSFRGVRLGQSLADARSALPRGVATSPPLPTPLDAPSAPLGVSSYPADATGVRGRGIGLLVVRGRVASLFITDPRAEAIAGVGVGDNLGVARDRLRGLVCARSNGGEPTCAGRSGHYAVLFVDDPITTITLSAIDTGWCLVRSAACRRPDAPTQIRPR